MYEKSKKEFQVDEFENPSNEYRGAPFWAWNGKLEREELLRQITYFREMGMGGFHIHSRTGLEIKYLGEEFMEHVVACVEEAERQGMQVYLYDEDRWPSGFGGGAVTKNPEYKSRYLVFTPFQNDEQQVGRGNYTSSMKTNALGNGICLGSYEVVLEEGRLKSYRYLKGREFLETENKANKGEIWYLYEEIADKSPWFNNESYADTLNPEAVQEFIRVTHERYNQCIGEKFGKIIPSIFTDEPQFPHKTTLSFPEEKKPVILPYTKGFPKFYKKMYGEDFFSRIPEIIFETVDETGLETRYRYHNALAECFAEAYADTIGKWCQEHEVLLTGHMMMEESLESQTRALGEAMRSYRSFGIPGIDMLCDRREYSTAKQAQSASHQYGCPGVVSELYGVTDWDFDFRHHKLAGDWQACLGVTLRVPHLSWYTMRGEAKRDLPASIFSNLRGLENIKY